MAESEPQSREHSPEVQLFARLRLQRVVFGAFAVVLVCLFAMGAGAYRQMQRERDAAQQAQADAVSAASDAKAALEQRERELLATRRELEQTRGRLALALCRNAMHETRDGFKSRAQALLAEAKQLGPPAWWPLANHLARDTSVRFATDRAADPVITGAISADGSTLAVARATPDGAIVETFDALTGKASPLSAAIPGNAETGRMLVRAGGTAWYLSMPQGAFYGAGGAVEALPRGPMQDWEPAAPLAIAGNDDLSIVWEAHGAHGLVMRARGEAGQWSTQAVTLDVPGDVQAVSLFGDKPVVATPRGIYVVGAGGRTGLLHQLDGQGNLFALHAGPGLVCAAVLTGVELELFTIKPGERPQVESRRVTLPGQAHHDLLFQQDGGLFALGPFGRVYDWVGDYAADFNLGGSAVKFVARHSYGYVFGNVSGEVSLTMHPGWAPMGESLYVVPQGYNATPLAHGFILESQGGRIVVQGKLAKALDVAGAIVLAPAGPAWLDAGLMLPNGSASAEKGVLLGAFGDDSVLLLESRKLKLVSTGATIEFLLPEDRAPDDVAFAATATVAALRFGDNIYVADMETHPRLVAGRQEAAPDRFALAPDGQAIAIAYGATVVVRGINSEGEAIVRTKSPPGSLALLFEGTVLATAEDGEVAYYEVASGRELFRVWGRRAAVLAASGDDALNVIFGDRLYTLDLSRD